MRRLVWMHKYLAYWMENVLQQLTGLSACPPGKQRHYAVLFSATVEYASDWPGNGSTYEITQTASLITPSFTPIPSPAKAKGVDIEPGHVGDTEYIPQTSRGSYMKNICPTCQI